MITDKNDIKIANRAIRMLKVRYREHLMARELKSILPKPEQIYKVGDKFKHKDGERYILARTSHNEYALINIENGNRFKNAYNVGGNKKITKEEMVFIADNQLNDFKRIGDEKA